MSDKKQLLINRNYFPVFFLTMICLMGSCFVAELSAGSIIKEIIKLEKENQELNEKIIAKLRFELYKNETLDGETCKYVLRNKESDDLWLFKVYKSSIPVNNTIVTYRLAQLFGLDISEITRTVLPTNERMQYGSIQKIIPGVKKIYYIPFSQLSSEQIGCIMRNQVLDWLVFNGDVDEEEFIIKGENGKIIVIDKDETFYDEESTQLADNVGEDSYYYKFWEAYLKGDFNISNVNFEKVFEMIDYIQNIGDKHIICIINDLLKDIKDSSELNFIIEKVISRKHNLRVDFGGFYENLVKAKKTEVVRPLIDKNNVYARIVLKKLDESVSQKKAKLAQLKLKSSKRQESIMQISCSDAWYLVKELNYVSRGNFFSSSNQTIMAMDNLKEKVSSIYEKFVINIYLEQIRNLQNKRGMENFIQRKIKEIILYPEEITDSKILSIESNLRAIYGKPREKLNKYKKLVNKKSRDIFIHLDYFQYPIGEGESEEENLILKEYKELLDENPDNLTYKVLYGILLNDIEYLKKIENDFVWKYLGLALLYAFEGHEDEEERNEREVIIQECNKAFLCSDKKESAFLIYVLRGLLYQYNNNWERFGKGFEPKKSIIEYKKAVMNNPKNVKARLNLGILYLILEKPMESLKEFKEVNKLNSQYGKEHFHFNKIKEKSSYKDNKEYLDAIRMNTLSGKHHYLLGLACLIKEDKYLAKRHFNKAKEFGYKEKD